MSLRFIFFSDQARISSIDGKEPIKMLERRYNGNIQWIAPLFFSFLFCKEATAQVDPTMCDLITDYQIGMLVIAGIIGGLFVALHWWFSSRLFFFDFRSMPRSSKGESWRLNLPWFLGALVSFFIPPAAMRFSFELQDALGTSGINDCFTEWYWRLFGLAAGWWWVSIQCAFLAVVSYWVVGGVVLLINKRRG